MQKGQNQKEETLKSGELVVRTGEPVLVSQPRRPSFTDRVRQAQDEAGSRLLAFAARNGHPCTASA